MSSHQIPRRSFLGGVLASLGALTVGRSKAAAARNVAPPPRSTPTLELPPAPTVLEAPSPTPTPANLACRRILPMSSGVRLSPKHTTAITARVQRAFRPERVVIAQSENWIVKEFTVHGRSQRVERGELGDVFSALARSCTFDRCEADQDIQIVVTYVGADPEGEAFVCGILGYDA